jgi:enoyl-CoA hydratase
MNYENIRMEKRGAVATVVLNRAKALNALNAAMFAELDAAFGELGSDEDVRVVLLTGAGERAFAAGADIRELDAVGAGKGKEFALRGQAVFRKIETLGKPVIACVRGFALGGGCELAMSCTLRLAAEDAKFGQPEVKLGGDSRIWGIAAIAATSGARGGAEAVADGRGDRCARGVADRAGG